ncbi:rRNA maturation RNase YbeY [Neisseria leonii]|uniref:Endoribonuclease YbeY n=1 Tax=Neisseria leonii TaxID=2995413 RepID=A0A9X4DZX2_9NEIS|nr:MULTISPECIES: rRNA maturation RNase YbeY [unclassified Neisseria]MDD9325570.1 rRNA maturation RNase YbeY [Neisseria sp. 3986]MDD9326841.1 rRNA maturation RNase YbeY [Neisseria sp. 51.81]
MKTAKRYPFLTIQQRRLKLFFDNQSSFAPLPGERDFYRWVWQAVKNSYRRAEIGLLLLDEAEARRYNRDYRNKDYATNVLSFALNEGDNTALTPFSDGLRGDLIICPQVVAKEAAEQGKSPEAHFAHLTLHGTLHLMGYDHVEEAEAEAMETLETRLLNQLGYPNPYQHDET